MGPISAHLLCSPLQLPGLQECLEERTIYLGSTRQLGLCMCRGELALCL